jgi:apolipoprotein D and lipocalin family protein
LEKENMRSLLIGLVLILSSAAYAQRDTERLESVPFVDISRYTGKWYELAKYPNRFQSQCVSDTTATYTIKPNGRIEVLNKCRTRDGSITRATGEAKIADRESNSQLKVRFAPGFLSFLPFVWANYWVIDIGSDYEYAVVGEPKRNYFWILSRSPEMDETKLNSILERAQRMGFDPSRVERTRHTSAVLSSGAGTARN